MGKIRYSLDWAEDRVVPSSSAVAQLVSSRRISILPLLMIAACVALGVVIALGIRHGGAPALATELQVAKPTSTINVLVPRWHIRRGEKLHTLLFNLVPFEKDRVPMGAITEPDLVLGAYAQKDLDPGQVVVKENVADHVPPNPVIASIPSGYRAVSIRLNDTTGIEGWARAGANVDVLLIAPQGGILTASRVAHNARVLSTDQTSEPSAERPRSGPTSATLLVRRNEAQRIGLAGVVGTLVLHLRGANSKESDSSTELTLRDLLRDKGGSGARAETLPSIKALSLPRLPNLGGAES